MRFVLLVSLCFGRIKTGIKGIPVLSGDIKTAGKPSRVKYIPKQDKNDTTSKKKICTSSIKEASTSWWVFPVLPRRVNCLLEVNKNLLECKNLLAGLVTSLLVFTKTVTRSIYSLTRMRKIVTRSYFRITRLPIKDKKTPLRLLKGVLIFNLKS